MQFYIKCSLKRRKGLIPAGICAALVVLLCLFFGSLRSYGQQLTQLARAVPVKCQISNKCGSRETGIFISDEIVRALEGSALVAEPHILATAMAAEGEIGGKADWSKIDLHVSGANGPEVLPGLEKLELAHGSETDFYASDRLQGVVSEQMLEQRGWQVGDTVALSLFYFLPDNDTMSLSTNRLGRADVEIAGTMRQADTATEITLPDILLPLPALRALFRSENIPFFADTVSFRAADPLQLNEFKAMLIDTGLQEVQPGALDSYAGYALAIKDSQFLLAATDLRRAQDGMRLLLPVVVLMVLLIGYVVSSLLGSSRIGEYILLRLQGAGRWRSAAGFWLEQSLWVLLGMAAGDLLMGLFSSEPVTILIVNGVLLAAYLLGAAAAYGRMSRGSVMRLLSER